MNDFDELVNKTKIFLKRLENGEFQNNQEQAFEQLNILCQHEGVKDFLISDYFPTLLRNQRGGVGHIKYLSNSALSYSLPSLANILAESLINRYFRMANEELLDSLVDLILAFRLFDLLSIENEGRNIRFESENGSFTVKTELVRSELRMHLLRITLAKYSRVLIKNGPPNAQEIQPIILRLNTIINLISCFEQAEILRHPNLLAIGLTDNISYSDSNSFKLFGCKLTDLEYDERLFNNYGIPLLPIINKDKINFDGQKLQFQNEGLGTLPPFSVAVAVGEKEFEIGENPGFVEAEQPKNMYLNDPSVFAEFLKQHSPNTDVKINFMFKKFDRSFEYSILAEPVGDWLQKMPTQSVELALPYEAPFEQLSPKEFERLCYWIAEEYQNDDGTKRFEGVVWLGEDGGGEQGRDVIAVETKTNKRFVFQCKRVEKFIPSEIEEELRTFQGYVTSLPDIKPDVYILFVSSAITAETKRRGDLIAQAIGMEIDYWPKSKIDRLVRTYDQVRDRFWKIIQTN